MTLPFQHPFSAVVAGPSSCGKTCWVEKLLQHRQELIIPPPKKVFYCYTEWQPLYDRVKGVEFRKGLLDVEEIDTSVPNLIVCDDMMELCGQEIAAMFTKHSHHRNLSVVYLTQNLFHKGQHTRNINLNSSHLVLFKNPREINQINYLSRQMYPPEEARFLQEAFRDATASPYGYLCIDLKQDTPDIARVKTRIFPEDDTYIYVPKSLCRSLQKHSPTETDHE